MSRGLRSAAAAALIVLALFPTSVAAVAPTFETPQATSEFGTGVTFRQAFESPVPLARVEVLLDFPQSIGPFVAQAAGPTAAGTHNLTFSWLLASDGHLVPNTPITARWRLVPEDRSAAPIVGPPVQVVYADTRYDWHTLEGDMVRLHWYEGSNDFGRRALAIGEKAVSDAAAFLGVKETTPIDFYVYADQQPFYDALGPGTRENVGGEAHSDIRTMFALIRPDEVSDAWVGIVIPHELTHLVFDTAVSNPYHFPPRWLNEGVAVYLSEGYKASDRSLVGAAVNGQRLMPLQALEGQFPTSAERFYLAYAESVSAVDFLVRAHGAAALVSLINSYSGGVTDDEAFRAAVGTDVTGFERAWLDDLGAAAPVEHGPQPAPAGPIPPGWAGPAPGAPGATAVPGATALPGATTAPGATPDATAGAGAGAGSTGDSPLQSGWVLAAAALAGVLVGGSLAYVRRRRAAAPTAVHSDDPTAVHADAHDATPAVHPETRATVHLDAPPPVHQDAPDATGGAAPGAAGGAAP